MVKMEWHTAFDVVAVGSIKFDTCFVWSAYRQIITLGPNALFFLLLHSFHCLVQSRSVVKLAAEGRRTSRLTCHARDWSCISVVQGFTEGLTFAATATLLWVVSL